MARRKTEGPRVLGPYPDRNGHRIIIVRKDGTRESRVFESKAEALRTQEALTAEFQKPAATIREAMKDYVKYMLEDKGNKPRSVDQTKRKLRRFFPDVEIGIADLEPNMCAALYESFRKSPSKPQRRADGSPARTITKPVSVDYHRNALSEAKTFLNWCVKRKMIPVNPLADVEGVGRRNHGKEQLRIDEARKWIARATELAEQEETGAIAAMMTLLMGMRCTEIVERVVRDVDDDGRQLWIPDSKTAKGKRRLHVPEMLQPYLLALTEDKKPNEPLFANPDGKTYGRDWPRKWVKRICTEVGVLEVTAHGQRGLHSTLAVEAGVTARAVADALGHESFATTQQSYAQPEAVGRARQETALRVLNGGKAKDGVAA